jgi:spore coat polysaccharide biosynthesis protein SpsF (cytidylyltransferase family)
MKTGAIIQAHMSYDRLLGEVLKNVEGKQLIQYILIDSKDNLP